MISLCIVKMQLFYLSLKTCLLVILNRIFNLQLSLTREDKEKEFSVISLLLLVV